MVKPTSNNWGPLVTVMMPTYNRRRYLPEALASALSQTYRNIEIILINDGGEDISDIVRYYDDARVRFIDRKQNRGKPYSLNEGLSVAKGKYVCYLDDDDIYYPHHVETLVRTLEDGEKYQAAYSDLYKVHCKVAEDGSRFALAKNVEISRDFDRFLLMHYNLALHVSLMHRRDMLKYTGNYNEDLRILIDWDMTRKLGFYADFVHVPIVTGEFFAPVDDCDRITVKHRRDTADYLRNLLTIRASRPAKPWPRMQDMSIILLAKNYEPRLHKTIRDIWMHTFYPYQLILPMSADDHAMLESAMPNLVRVEVPDCSSDSQKIDTALKQCQGDYIAIVTLGYKINCSWIETSLYALIHNSMPSEALELEHSDYNTPAYIMRAQDLVRARSGFGNLNLQQSLNSAGIKVRKAPFEDYCFMFDSWLKSAKNAQQRGDYAHAANIYGHMEKEYGNELWMKTMRSNSLYKIRRFGQALEIIEDVNSRRPTISTLLLEGRIRKQRGDYDSALNALQKAEQWLKGSMQL